MAHKAGGLCSLALTETVYRPLGDTVLGAESACRGWGRIRGLGWDWRWGEAGRRAMVGGEALS